MISNTARPPAGMRTVVNRSQFSCARLLLRAKVLRHWRPRCHGRGPAASVSTRGRPSTACGMPASGAGCADLLSQWGPLVNQPASDGEADPPEPGEEGRGGGAPCDHRAEGECDGLVDDADQGARRRRDAAAARVCGAAFTMQRAAARPRRSDWTPFLGKCTVA